MPALIGLIVVVAYNTWRAFRGKSTICSTTRKFVPVPVFAGIIAWLTVHWLRPVLRRR